MQAVVISIEFAERIHDGGLVIKAVTEQLLESEFKDELMARIEDHTREDIVLQRINIRADDQEEWNKYFQMAIYDHPKDFPNHFVVRKWFLRNNEPSPDPVAYCVNSLEEARKIIPPGLVRTPRDTFGRDDSHIVETWI